MNFLNEKSSSGAVFSIEILVKEIEVVEDEILKLECRAKSN